MERLCPDLEIVKRLRAGGLGGCWGLLGVLVGGCWGLLLGAGWAAQLCGFETEIGLLENGEVVSCAVGLGWGAI